MQAIFRFNGSEEIVVSSQVGNVLLEVIESRAATEQDKAMIDGTDLRDSTSPYIDASGYYRHTKAIIPFSKSGARSVASALMQAAAEL